MGRKKVNLAWILNDSARKATLRKRRKGLMKKVTELSTLCGVEACAVIVAPHDPHPEAWPSIEGAKDVLRRFRNLPEMEQSKKMTNQEGFLQQQDAKLREQLQKQERENRELYLTILMYDALAGEDVHHFEMSDVIGLSRLIDMKMKMVRERLEVVMRGQMIKGDQESVSSCDQAAVLFAAAPAAAPGVTGVELGHPVQQMNSMMDGGFMGFAMQPYIDHTSSWPELDHVYFPPYN